MRETLDSQVLFGRLVLSGFPVGNSHNGAFSVRGPLRRRLILIVSSGKGWEHCSVHVDLDPTIAPTWEEMCFVKDLIWKPDEVVIQYHPAKESYVNIHPGTLHLWRPVDQEIPVPPIELV